MTERIPFVAVHCRTPTSTGTQRRPVPGNILHYIYRSTLGQSLQSQMRQVRHLAVRATRNHHESNEK